MDADGPVGQWSPEFLALRHESKILGHHSSNPVCGFSVMELVRFCAVWPMENCLGSSLKLKQIQCWTTVRESYSRASEQETLRTDLLVNGHLAGCWVSRNMLLCRLSSPLFSPPLYYRIDHRSRSPPPFRNDPSTMCLGVSWVNNERNHA